MESDGVERERKKENRGVHNTSNTEINYQLAKTKGKKWMQSPSPMLQPSVAHSLQSPIELLTWSHSNSEVSDTPQTKRAKVTETGNGGEDMATNSTSHNLNDLQTSPAAWQITQALKVQQCPTNKEICSFCKCLSQ